MKKLNLKKYAVHILAGCSLIISAGLPGYDHNGNDIDECQYNPCPDGYTCMNIPGSFLCRSIEDGEIIEGGSSIGRSYIKHDTSCNFYGIVDDAGYITINNIRKKTSLLPGSPYNVTFRNATRSCEYGGAFSCSSYSCEQFWKEAGDVNPAF